MKNHHLQKWWLCLKSAVSMLEMTVFRQTKWSRKMTGFRAKVERDMMVHTKKMKNATF